MKKAAIASEITRSRIQAENKLVMREPLLGFSTGTSAGGWGISWGASGAAAISFQFYWIGCAEGRSSSGNGCKAHGVGWHGGGHRKGKLAATKYPVQVVTATSKSMPGIPSLFSTSSTH